MEGGGHLDRYTVTDMCVDLACCFDTLEQDLVNVILLCTTTTYTHVPIVYYHYTLLLFICPIDTQPFRLKHIRILEIQ